MSRRWGPRRKSPDAAERGFIEPCLATLKPAPPSEGAWVHEIKFDGYRMMARQGADGPMLFTRMGFDWTERFGERIADAIDALPSTGAYLDGEVVVEDERGVSSFAALQDDLQRGRTDRFLYYAFDLLQLNGKDLRQQPLVERKAALARLLKKLPRNSPVRFSTHLEDDPQVLLDQSCRLGLEGIISKRADRPYRSGRGVDWIKSRCMQQEVFVIAGYEPTKASPRQIGALLLGKRVGGAFHYMGHVGTGFSRSSAAELWKRLSPRRRKENPFANIDAKDLAGAVFVEPELAAEIDYRGWTGEGRVRHASFRGLVEEPVKKAPVASGRRPSKPKSKPRRPEDVICDAIVNRLKLELRYHKPDDPKSAAKWRLYHPHAVYREEDGALAVAGRQETGRGTPMPRELKVPQILELRLRDEHFKPGPRVKTTEPKYRFGIVCMIDDD